MRDLPDNHQIEQLHAALQFVTDYRLAIDVGAHRGIWTRIMLSYFDKVVAIEPTDLANQIPKSAQVIQAAAGASENVCQMRNGKRNNGQTYVSSIGGAGTTPVIAIDELNLEPTFIKIDVEGMEADVLLGARRTIKKHRPAIMLEENGLDMRYGHRADCATRIMKKWGAVRVATFHMLPEKDENRLFVFP